MTQLTQSQAPSPRCRRRSRSAVTSGTLIHLFSLLSALLIRLVSLWQDNFRKEIFWTSGRLISGEDRIADPPGLYPGSTPTASVVDPPFNYSPDDSFPRRQPPSSSSSSSSSRQNSQASWPAIKRPLSRNESLALSELNFVGEIRNWVWYSTGKQIRLQNWMPGNPRPDPNATCVELNTETYMWASYSCLAKFRFVCEINYDA